MRKIIGIMLLLVILMNASALAEDFTLHNGTKFGMTKEEVIKLEQENSFNLKQDSLYYRLLYGKGKIAGIDGTVNYLFSDNSLYCMSYVFRAYDSGRDRLKGLSLCQEYFTSIENGLKLKYGDTKYNSLTLLAVPSFEEGIPFDSTGSLIRHEYSHRIIEIGTDEYVFIEHYIQERRSGQYSSFDDMVYYHYLDATSAKNLFDNLNQQQDDL